MTITAREALPGDVVLDTGGTEWKRGDEFYRWATFDGPVTYEGPWKASYGPQGELTLLVRDGEPVVQYGGSAEFAITDVEQGELIAVHRAAGASAIARVVSADHDEGCVTLRIEPGEAAYERASKQEP